MLNTHELLDQGPNTGGMGVYSPPPVSLVPDALLSKIHETILQPTVDALRAERMPFCGWLFTGLMLGDEGEVNVLEYNTRGQCITRLLTQLALTFSG